MSYASIETSAQSGRPVELYEFLNGATAYRYTSAAGDVSYGGHTYTAVPIARGAVEATSETARLALEITCARSLGVLALFALMPPAEVVAVTLRRLHAGDGEAVTLWMGRVLNVTLNNVAAEIHCESVYTSLKRVGLRRTYGKPCPHVVYRPGCGLDRNAFKAVKTVSAVSGTTITLSAMGAFAAGYFSGGYLEWESSAGYFEQRAIRSQVGGVLTIGFPLPGLAAAASVNLYPGCDHTFATCAGKFGNGLNYGGQPHWPSKNPFDGTIIY
jgi:uncharacterized phage protein (TIGR02218 family)